MIRGATKTFVGRGPFSALAGRILALNMAALAFLVGGVLYLDQFRTGLVETRLTGLLSHAEVIAAAIGEAATAGPDATAIDAARGNQILARLVVPTGVRARLFDRDGTLLIDSRDLFTGRKVSETPLPAPSLWTDLVTRLVRAYESVILFMTRDRPLQRYVEQPVQAAGDYDEVMVAMGGIAATAARTTERGSLVLSAAVPVQRFRRVLGAVMASVETSEIEEMVRQERLAILELFVIALVAAALLSLVLARTIARPVHRLAEAADKVRRRHGRDVTIPDFSRRRDEIGDLSRSLRDMTEALYGRIDAIEAFAADVAHEIKNPLTSLRSAVETLARQKDAGQQAKLLAIISEDVGRMDRLISDISNASRIDAELSRADMTAVDIGAMLATLVDVYRATSRAGNPDIELDLEADTPLIVQGLESKLARVMRNLLDNAVSFSTGKAGAIHVHGRRDGDQVTVTIDDRGPGIPEDMLGAIFDRFYSERPQGEAFGRHSGLGLSISRQIVEAHGGTIEARNRRGPVDGPEPPPVIGARLIVRLPI